MATNADQVWRLSGGGGNSDPAQSLGGAISATNVHEFEATSDTAVTAPSNAVFDAGVGGLDDDHNGKFLLFVTGPNELFAARILDYRASDGRFILETNYASNVGIGDVFRVFDTASLFDTVTPTESALGDTEYRGIYVANTSGQVLTDNRIFAQLLDPGAAEWAFSADDNDGGAPVIPLAPDQKTEPDIVTMAPTAAFRTQTTFEFGQPHRDLGVAVSLGIGGHRGAFLRRTTPANARTRPNAIVLLVSEATSPAPAQQVRTGCIIELNAAGFTPVAAIRNDRSGRIGGSVEGPPGAGGGVRVEVVVTALETGMTVPALEVGWSLVSGPGTLLVSDEFGSVTDDAGFTFASYTGPGDRAEAGNSAVVEFKA